MHVDYTGVCVQCTIETRLETVAGSLPPSSQTGTGVNAGHIVHDLSLAAVFASSATRLSVGAMALARYMVINNINIRGAPRNRNAAYLQAIRLRAPFTI